MSGSNYHVSFSQILETERRLKVSSILKLFSQQPCKQSSLKSFFKSFSSDETANDSHTDLNPFLSKLQDIFTAILDNETIQSLAFIAGYCVHQFFKSQKIQDCRLCLDFLTADRNLLFDPEESIKYKLIEILDRGSLKWPSDPVLDSIITVWRIIITLKQDVDIWTQFVNGKSREILIELSIRTVEDTSSETCRNRCLLCDSDGWEVLRKLVSVASNCLISNLVKNFNSQVASRVDSRKFKKLKVQ